MAVRIVSLAITVRMPRMRMGTVRVATMRVRSFASVVPVASRRENQHSSDDSRYGETATYQNSNGKTAEHSEQLTVPQKTFPQAKKPRSEFSEDFAA